MPVPSLETRLAALETRLAVLEERVVNRHDALTLQAHEYERRLTALNNDREEARNKEIDFLPAATYEKSEEARLSWQRDVDAALTSSGTSRALAISIFSAAGVVLGLIIEAVVLFWSHT